MESELRDSSAVLTRGNVAQFEFLLDLYPQALQLKAESKKKKPEELKKYDQWYTNELPSRIKQRCVKEGTGYLTHEELIQTIKWKLARGKWRPRLKELITMNTPRVVQVETKKAIRQLMKKDDLTSAIQAMCNLKGVGPAMASAVLSATMPDSIPYMSDECMLSLPGMSDRSIDYTVAEYLKMVKHVRRASKRLASSGESKWTPRCIEQVLFSHHVIVHQKPELLEKMPAYTADGGGEAGETGDVKVENGTSVGDTAEASSDENTNTDNVTSNGQTETNSTVSDAEPTAIDGEDSRDTVTSSSAPADLVDNDEATNDSVMSNAGSSSCPTVTEDEDTCVDEDSNAALPSHPSDTAENSVPVSDESAVANGNGRNGYQDETSNQSEANSVGEKDSVASTTIQESDPNCNEDVIRTKRAATDESMDQATPSKCAKTVELATSE